VTYQTLLTGAGLCAVCVHARVVTSGKGSTFLLCRMSETDPRFRKYPALPVVRCDGFERAPGESRQT
jgi:hypothetical protein